MNSGVAIALGSNLGDREAHLAFAVERLGQLLTNLRVSSAYRTAPVGVPAQPDFLNAAAIGGCALPPRALLDALLGIEAARGRVRPHPGAPRVLDLDLVLYGDAVIDEPGLRVPHPRFRDREFVLAPLAEVAPDWRDPVSGRTIVELRAALAGR